MLASTKLLDSRYPPKGWLNLSFTRWRR